VAIVPRPTSADTINHASTFGRTPRQDALLSSPAAWAWWLAGYERGAQSGYEQGYLDAMRVLDDAGAFLASLEPSRSGDVVAARARRTALLAAPGPAEDLAERHRLVAESWGLSEGAA
jgi:hypothetical protein